MKELIKRLIELEFDNCQTISEFKDRVMQIIDISWPIDNTKKNDTN